MRARRSPAPSVAPGRLIAPYRPPPLTVIRPRVSLQIIEDRRRFHPLGKLAPAATYSRRDQRRIVEKVRAVTKQAVRTRAPVFPASDFGFAVPDKVAVCVRRKQRREALFAKRKTGRGARAQTRRRGPFTEIHC